MGALDDVAGPRNRGQLRISFHQSRGTAQARCDPGAVGRSRRRIRVGAIPPASRGRPGPRARSEACLRPSIGSRNFGPTRVRANCGVSAAPRAGLRATRRRRGRGGGAAGGAVRVADQPGDLVRRRPAAPSSAGARGPVRGPDRRQGWGPKRRKPTRRLGVQRSRQGGPRGGRHQPLRRRRNRDHRCAGGTTAAATATGTRRGAGARAVRGAVTATRSPVPAAPRAPARAATTSTASAAWAVAVAARCR
ncbi:hypothetical protein MSIMFI_01687 [Mycobacterium simulans]|nr:hypothetical protein MSIMFI_01687 [Mycobacterium simulans]